MPISMEWTTASSTRGLQLELRRLDQELEDYFRKRYPEMAEDYFSDEMQEISTWELMSEDCFDEERNVTSEECFKKWYQEKWLSGSGIHFEEDREKWWVISWKKKIFKDLIQNLGYISKKIHADIRRK